MGHHPSPPYHRNPCRVSGLRWDESQLVLSSWKWLLKLSNKSISISFNRDEETEPTCHPLFKNPRFVLACFHRSQQLKYTGVVKPDRVFCRLSFFLPRPHGQAPLPKMKSQSPWGQSHKQMNTNIFVRVREPSVRFICSVFWEAFLRDPQQAGKSSVMISSAIWD